MDLGIAGKKALVFASTKGLGKASALELSRAGCRVVISSRSEENCINVADEFFAATGIRPEYAVIDVEDIQSVQVGITKLIHDLDGIDIFVFNGGGPKAGYFGELAPSDWDNAYTQIIKSFVTATELILPHMQRSRWGRIIAITSIAALEPMNNLVLSTTFRTGITGLCKVISNQYAKYDITCNTIAPGLIATDRLEHLATFKSSEENITLEQAYAALAAGIPAERLGKPEEIGSLVAYICSLQASYITGSTFHVDGGKYKGL